ncbi:hypothetical protein YC2023_004320 [Brassica napus]
MIFLPFCFERKSALRLTALRKHQKNLENPLSIFFRVKKKLKNKKGCNTRTSREVTHPSTTLAQARLAAEF